MKRTLHVSLLLASFLSLGVQARADVIPPEVYACQNKQAGDACTPLSGGSGACQSQLCSRIDYSSWDRDASSSPPSSSYECLYCSTASATATNTAGPTNTATQTSTALPTSTPTETVTGTDTTTTTDTVTSIVPPTQTPTETATSTATPTVTPTATETATLTTTTTAAATDTTTASTKPASTATDSGAAITPPSTTTNTGSDTPPSSDDSACSVSRHAAAKRLAPWLLAGLFSLLFLFGRRRDR